MFRDAAEVERACRDQNADAARIDAAIDAAQAAIAALAGRQLDPEAARQQWSAIRDQTMLAIRDVRHNVIKRARLAKDTERWLVEKWLRELNGGRILRGFTAELQDVPTRKLLDHLRYLIEFANIGRIQSVNAVFAARADNQGYKAAFDTMLGQFTLAQCGALGARIASIQDMAEMVDTKLSQLFSAHGRTRRDLLPVSPSVARIEGPNIDEIDADTGRAGEVQGAAALLQLSFRPGEPVFDRQARAAIQ